MSRLVVIVAAVLALAPTTTAAAAPSPEAIRARMLLDAGGDDAARRLAEPLANAAAPDALALQVLGRIARREGRTEDALRLLEAAVAADPLSSDAHVHLGGAYVDKLRSVGALRQLGWARKLRAVVQRAVDLDPASCNARRALAEFYLEAPKIAGGSPERARLEASQFRDRCAAHGHLAFALAAQTAGNLTTAETACLDALRADPDRGEGYALLGWITRLQGASDATPATAAAHDLLVTAPAWHRALYDAGRSGVLPGPNIEKAEAGLRSAIQRERAVTRRARLLWSLGLAHQIRGDGDAAWREFTAALALAPGMDLAMRGRESLVAADARRATDQDLAPPSSSRARRTSESTGS